MSLVLRKPAFCIYAKTKTQISFAVTAKLISAFVFATRIVQFLYFLNLKFQASSHLLWLYSLVCVGPGRKPRRPVFSQRGLNLFACFVERARYDMGHIWPPLKISSNVVFSISHLLNKIKLRTEHVPACRKKSYSFSLFHAF